MRTKMVILSFLILLLAVLGLSVSSVYCCYPVGDIDRNGVVDMRDLAVLARAFGSYPGASNWNPKADLNQDSVVNMRDAAILLDNFGDTMTP